jgi:ribosomal protein S18 acetylase RimI-like enzyme
MYIRDYEPLDFGRISKLNKESNTPAEPDSFVLESIERGRAWVAVEGEEIIGFLIGLLKHGIPYVNNVTVSEKHRKQGIATKLFTKFETHYGAEQRIENRKFWLQVKADNPAQKLYFDLGYRVGWVDEHYYGRNVHALCMYKSNIPFSSITY